MCNYYRIVSHLSPFIFFTKRVGGMCIPILPGGENAGSGLNHHTQSFSIKFEAGKLAGYIYVMCPPPVLYERKS